MIGIYKITNKINGKFYIGQSIHIEHRIMDHKAPRSSKRNYPICRAIKKYGRENFSYEIIEVCQLEQLNEKEINYIKTLCPHYNISEGGSGNRGYCPSPELRKHLSRKNKEYWENLSDEKKIIVMRNLKTKKNHLVREVTKKKISETLMGHNYNTPKSNSLRSDFMKEYSKNHDMARRKRAVLQLDKITGEVLNEFETIKQAAEAVAVGPTCVLGVIKGRRKTTGGFRWEYKIIAEKDASVKGK